MRALIVALGLSLFVTTATSCVSLSAHARVVKTTAGVLDAARAAIIAKKFADLKTIRTTPSDVPQAEREAKLSERFAPVDAAYGAAHAALEHYYLALADALERRERRLSVDHAAALLAAWVALADVGEPFGCDIPRPTPAVEDLVKELGK